LTEVQTGLSRRSVLRGFAAAVPLLAIPGLLSACAPVQPDANGRRRLRVSQTADPRTLDPQKQGDMVSMNALIGMFDMLTMRMTDNTLGPRLATSWEAIDDLTWRFHLRQGVTFHNGEKFDANVVKFSIERLINPATKSPIVELRYVTGVNVIDEFTADLITSAPDPVIPAKVSLFGGVMLPPAYLAKVGDDGFAKAPVGTGPFSFVSYQRSVSLRMQAFEGHWQGKPSVDDLEIQTISNPASALAALQSNEVDMVTGLVPDAALQLQGYTGTNVATYPGLRMSYLSLDTTDPVLSDVRVRQALNHAIDVPLLIKAVLNGQGREVPTMIPREAFGFDDSIPAYSRDLDLAKSLLAEAGHPDGFDTTITASNADSAVAQAISGLLVKVGVRAAVNLLDPSTYSTRLTSDNKQALGPIYLAASTSWTLDGQSPVQSNVRSDRRQSRWSNPQADALIDGEELSSDPAARQVAFSNLQKLLSQEAPFVFLYQINTILIQNNQVSWTPNVIGNLTMATAEVHGG
jgi:peptide/nickel transport system substrate-binding protein